MCPPVFQLGRIPAGELQNIKSTCVAVGGGGGGGVDQFRIKIWDITNGDVVIYDNQYGSADDSSAATALGGGSIIMHKSGDGK